MSAFPKSEYLARLGRVKAAMAEAGIETLCAADPASLNYLTGYDGWSFYVHQFVVVIDDREEPLWVGRAIDAPGAALTTFLAADSIVPYPETYIDSAERPPGRLPRRRAREARARKRTHRGRARLLVLHRKNPRGARSRAFRRPLSSTPAGSSPGRGS